MILLPNILPKPPSPTAGECDTLLQYTKDLIRELKQVSDRLEEASTMPDPGLEVIRGQVQAMLDETESMKRNLIAIRAEASADAIF